MAENHKSSLLPFEEEDPILTNQIDSFLAQIEAGNEQNQDLNDLITDFLTSIDKKPEENNPRLSVSGLNLEDEILAELEDILITRTIEGIPFDPNYYVEQSKTGDWMHPTEDILDYLLAMEERLTETGYLIECVKFIVERTEYLNEITSLTLESVPDGKKIESEALKLSTSILDGSMSLVLALRSYCKNVNEDSYVALDECLQYLKLKCSLLLNMILGEDEDPSFPSWRSQGLRWSQIMNEIEQLESLTDDNNNWMVDDFDSAFNEDISSNDMKNIRKSNFNRSSEVDQPSVVRASTVITKQPSVARASTVITKQPSVDRASVSKTKQPSGRPSNVGRISIVRSVRQSIGANKQPTILKRESNYSQAIAKNQNTSTNNQQTHSKTIQNVSTNYQPSQTKIENTPATNYQQPTQTIQNASITNNQQPSQTKTQNVSTNYQQPSQTKIENTPATNYQQPQTNYQQPITNYQQPSQTKIQNAPATNYQQPTQTNYQQPTTNYQQSQPKTDQSAPATNYHQSTNQNTTYKQPQTTNQIQSSTSNYAEQPRNQVTSINNHSANTQPETGPCYLCGKQLSGKIVRSKEKVWHKSCFICSICKSPIEGEYLYSKTGDLVCRACESNILKSCHLCGVVLRERYILFNGKEYHANCYEKFVGMPGISSKAKS